MKYIYYLFFLHLGFAGEYFEGGNQMGVPVKKQIKVVSML